INQSSQSLDFIVFLVVVLCALCVKKLVFRDALKINLIVLLLLLLNNLHPCTVAIISGKVTKDGRPLLWKQRDSDSLNNKLKYFFDGNYNYIGLINSSDSQGKEIWAGTNSAGFSIMNSASYNLNLGDTSKIKDREGIIMKLALQSCSKLSDFETLLDKLIKPMGLEANFGIIDSYGGCAFYEVSNYKYTKFDANDPAIAPFGYIIRTNFSFTGKAGDGYGHIRYRTAEELFYQAALTDELNPEFILQKASRSTYNSLTKTDLCVSAKNNELNPETFINTDDYIVRYNSSSTYLVKGWKKGDDKKQTLIWFIPGYAFCSVVIPIWYETKVALPEVISGNKQNSNSLICDFSLKLKQKCYPLNFPGGYKYLNLKPLFNNNTGIFQRIIAIEEIINKETKIKTEQFEKTGITEKELKDFYKFIDNIIISEYSKLLTNN
ncbi:MAG: hypothetical protein KA792_04075, partial [Bacteroidales bacterium]|nr:hypothetical protein [Bacteroidales bacterium]